MNTTRQHKSRQAQRYTRMKAGWNKIHNIVVTCKSGWGKREGFDAKGMWFDFHTNFGSYKLPVYKEAIRTYNGPAKFGLSDKAYGFYDDEGTSFPLGSEYYALYVLGSAKSLDDFDRHFNEVDARKEAEENEKYEKVRELNSRKVVYHKWYGLTEADATALAQKLTDELPDKWKKHFKYAIIQHFNQTFNVRFAPIDVVSSRPRSRMNLVNAYKKIKLGAHHLERNIIGKFQ